LQWNTASSKWKVEADYSYETCLKKLFTTNDFLDRANDTPLNLSDLQYDSSGLDLAAYADIDSQKKVKAGEALLNCKKYGNFTNGKMNNNYDNNGNIVNNSNRKFDFVDDVSKIANARKTDITNQYFREYVFNGIEYEDFGGCQNPYINHTDTHNIPQNKLADTDGIKKSIANLGYASVYQRYYLRGSASDGEEASTNYACQRFKRGGAGATFTRFKKAYECCEKKARTAICIEQKLPNTQEFAFNDEKYKYKSVERGDGDNRWYDYNLPYKFCTLGETDCQVNNMTVDKQQKSYGYKNKHGAPLQGHDENGYKKTEYTIFPSNDKRYICAKTVNLCPYDHHLGGGTEKKFESYDARSSDDVKNKVTANFCQYLSHCVKADIQSHAPQFPSNNYLSLACRNFIGDSLFTSDDLKNTGSLSIGGDVIIQRRARNLTAPMVQCLKETMENYLFNKRGIAICRNQDDYNEPEYLKDGICKNGALAGYEQGAKIGDSIFTKLRDRFKTAIKMALSLAIAIFALMMLFQGDKAADFLARKNLFPFILKISLVVFFALSDGWERNILKNILDTPLAVAEIIFNPKVNQDPKVLIKSANKVMPSKYSDGCIFPPRNSDGSLQVDNNGNPIKYPEGKEYLRIFDTFDCKISRLLLYSPEANVPNFMKMILTGFFSGPLGFAFVIASIAFAFFMILIALRVTHLTIISIMVVSLLLYIAPIAFLMMIFQRTKNIFDNWLKQLLGYMIQPVIVFAYLGLLLHVADKNFYGDAKFADLQDNYKPAAVAPSIDCSNRYDIYGRHIVVNDNVISDDESYNTNSNLCNMADSGIVEIDSANIEGINNPAGNNIRKDVLQPFNITIYAFESLLHNKKRLELMIQSAIIAYIFYKIFEQITILAARITNSQDPTNILNKAGSAFMDNAKSLYKKGAAFEKASREIFAKVAQRGIISDTASGIANTASDIQKDTKSIKNFMGGGEGSAKKDSDSKDSGGVF
jgi:type IV secretory pathway VirB6-like protein